MLGLLLKDYYSLRRYLFKSMGILLLLNITLGFALKSFASVAPMLILFVAIGLQGSFNADESSKWNSYALTLPVTPQMLVGEKHLLFYGGILGAGLIASLVCIALNAFTFHEDAGMILSATVGCAAAYWVLESISLPLLFKYGVEKARILQSMLFIIPYLLFIWGASYLAACFGSVAEFLNQMPWALLAAVGGMVLLALCAGSYCISVKIMECKEF